MQTKDYIKLATKVMDHYKFFYMPRGLAIVRCARYLKEVHAKYPEKPFTCLEMPYLAKHYYITQINLAYQYGQKKRTNLSGVPV